MVTSALLVSLSLVSGLREGQRQRSGRKIADVSDLRARGVSCELKGKTFCHAKIVRKYGSTYGQVCDNGDITLMRMPVDYAGPPTCVDEDSAEYCPGKIPGSETTFVEQWCIDGQIFYINKLTGNKFKKGRLSKPTKKVNKNKKKEKSTKSTSAPPATTTTSTTTSTTTTTVATTTTTMSTSSTTTGSTTRSRRRSTTTTMPLASEDYPSIPAVASATKDLDLNIPDGFNEIDDNEVHADNLVDVGVNVDYVNTVLENSIPNVKVLQCWSQFNICFIQVGPHPSAASTQHIVP